MALVMQSILDSPKRGGGKIYEGSPRIIAGNPFVERTAQLQPSELAELQETGLYFDPDAQAQFDEVQTIMELVVAQANVSPDQPTLPLDFVIRAA